MVAQAFFYNAIFFTYALILTDFFGIPADRVGWYLLPFAAGNFLGPALLGRLFDTIGRRPMIAFTYVISGLLLAGSGYLFMIGGMSATTQTIAWMVIFFFASAAASSAYLTVSETFPLESGLSRSLSSSRWEQASAASSARSLFGILYRYRIARERVWRLPPGRSPDDHSSRGSPVIRRGGRTRSLEDVARPLAFVE